MNILLIDAGQAFLDFALRCLKFGHRVRWYVAPKKGGVRSSVGDGLGIKVDEWEPHVHWADIVILSDNTRYMDDLARLKRRGFPILCGDAEAKDWELDREIGMQVMKRSGLKTIPYQTFHNYDKAEAYVTKTMKRYVSKPSGDADKALSYCSKSAQDLISMLRRWKRLGKGGGEFVLQEFVPGIEMAVGGWFGPNGFLPYFLENFEHKKLMNDDLGVNTGEMGTAIKYTTDSKLALELIKCSEELHRINYCGFVDLSFIIDENGDARPLEFTMRFGWPLFLIQQELHGDDPAGFLHALLKGDPVEFDPGDDIALGVVNVMPDFPYSHLTGKEMEGYPIYNLDPDNKYWPHLHPAELMFGEAPVEENGDIVDKVIFVSAGDYLVIACGTGANVRDAKRRAYEACESIEIPNSVGYRTDIGDRLKTQLPDLQAMGFAEEWTW